MKLGAGTTTSNSSSGVKSIRLYLTRPDFLSFKCKKECISGHTSRIRHSSQRKEDRIHGVIQNDRRRRTFSLRPQGVLPVSFILIFCPRRSRLRRGYGAAGTERHKNKKRPSENRVVL